MTWNAYHTESERLAGEAEARLARGHGVEARALYRRAAQAEERAFYALDPSKRRTRGITGVSALSLWLKAGDADEVRRLGARLLEAGPLPRFASAQIHEILDSVDLERGTGRHRYEVEITVRQTLRYAVEASSRRIAEHEAMERWRTGGAGEAAPGESELMDVHARPVPVD